MRFQTGTLIVTFEEVADSSIDELFEKMGLDGTRVSSFMKKYAVEVPAGEEDKYLRILEENDMVRSVNPYYLKGLRDRRPKKGSE